MAEKNWKEKRADQERANATHDATSDAARNRSRGIFMQALTHATMPVANAFMRNFNTPEYSDTYEKTYDAEMRKGEKGTQPAIPAPKRMAKGGSVCRGGGAAVRGTKFRGVK